MICLDSGNDLGPTQWPATAAFTRVVGQRRCLLHPKSAVARGRSATPRSWQPSSPKFPATSIKESGTGGQLRATEVYREAEVPRPSLLSAMPGFRVRRSYVWGTYEQQDELGQGP